MALRNRPLGRHFLVESKRRQSMLVMQHYFCALIPAEELSFPLLRTLKHPSSIDRLQSTFGFNYTMLIYNIISLIVYIVR